MLKQLLASAYSSLFGATGSDWTTSMPLPLYLRQAEHKDVEPPVKLKRCACSLLHDRPHKDKCLSCEHGYVSPASLKVVPMKRRAAK